MQDSDLGDGDRELLADVLAGRRGLDDSQVAALLSRSPAVRREIEDLRRLSSILDARARAQRADYAEFLESAAPPAADEAARVEAMLVGERQSRARSFRRRRTLVLVAALVLIAVAAAFWAARHDPAPRPDPRLGADPSASQGLPSGQVERYGTFSAAIVLPATSRCRFEVFDAATRLKIARSEDLAVARWQPDATQTALIEACPAIEWQLVRLDPEQGDTKLVTATARRR